MKMTTLHPRRAREKERARERARAKASHLAPLGVAAENLLGAYGAYAAVIDAR